MGMLSSIGPIWPFLRARDQGLQLNDIIQFFLTYIDSGEVTQESLGKTSIFMITFSTNLHIGFVPLRSLRKNGFRNRSQVWSYLSSRSPFCSFRLYSYSIS